MNKKSKLIIFLLLAALLTSVSYTTYARYASKATGNADASVAKWSVKLTDGNGQNDVVLDSATKTFAPTIVWDKSGVNVADGKIAPGVSGTATLKLDPTDSEVGIVYYVKVDESAITALNNNGFKVTGVTGNNVTLKKETEGNHEGEYKGTITWDGSAYKADDIVEIVATITWEDANTTDANSSDTQLGVNATTVAIPLTVTVEQDLAN